MRGLRVLAVLGVVLVVSLIAGAYAAGKEAPPMTAGDAREFTTRAFTFSGVKSVEVTGEPRAELFTPTGAATSEEAGVEGRQDGSEPAEAIPVWVVPAQVSNQAVELYVARNGDRAVNLDDALPGGGFVLTDEQFARLEQFRLDLAAGRLSDQRQGPAVAAGVLLGLASLLLLLAVVKGRRRGRDRSEAAPVDPAPADG